MNLNELKESIKIALNDSDDVITREFSSAGADCALFYLDGLTDKELLERDVIAPLLKTDVPPSENNLSEIVCFCEQPKPLSDDDCPQTIADGDVVLFASGKTFAISLRKFEKRAISEPPTSSVLKGPREGFIEEIKTNVSMIRRRIKSPALTVKNLKIGRYSNTAVSLVYLSGVADDKIVEEVTRKIESIDVDGVIDSAYVTSFIQGRRHTFFSQVGDTEKPDVAAAKILEGRIVVFVDGSPMALTLPFILFEDLQDGYDYYSEDWRAGMIRFFRLMGALLTVLLPGAYVALQSYHYHLLPLKFMITLLAATDGIPFPPAIEMLFVLLLFEILNQASIRMPRFMGISLSIVGAIVLGDTAVKAGLISSPAVLVSALSAIGIFCVPDQVGALSILRLLFLLVSAVIGLFGIVILMLILIAYLTSLESFGAAYLAPYAPRITPDLKDAMLKEGTFNMRTRPYSIPNKNRTRMRENVFNDNKMR